MSQFYVQLDDRRFVAKMARKLASTDDPKQWTSINLPTAKDIDFGVNFDKYQVDENGTVNKGGDDAVTLGDVNTQLASALDTINQQKTAIDTLTQDNQGLQQALGEATKAQVQAQQQFTQTTQTFQAQFGDLTKQFVELGKQVAALTPTKEG